MVCFRLSSPRRVTSVLPHAQAPRVAFYGNVALREEEGKMPKVSMALPRRAWRIKQALPQTPFADRGHGGSQGGGTRQPLDNWPTNSENLSMYPPVPDF